MSKKKITPALAAEVPPWRTMLDDAIRHFHKCEFVEVERIVREVMTQIEQNGTDLDRTSDDYLRSICILAECFEDTGRNDEALEGYRRALAVSEASAQLLFQARALNGIANIQKSCGELWMAIQTAERAVVIGEKGGNAIQTMMGLNTIALANEKIGDYPAALDYYARALAMAEGMNVKLNIATGLSNIGIVYTKIADYPRALDYYARSVAITEAGGNKSQLSATYTNLGGTFLALARYPESLDYYNRSLAIVTEMGDNSRIAIALCNLGALYYQLGDYTCVLDFLERALHLAEVAGEHESMYTILANIGSVHSELADYSRALDYILRALEIAEHSGSKSGQALQHEALGQVYSESGEYRLALDHLDRARILSEGIGDLETIGKCMYRAATVQRKLGNLDSAHQGYLKTLNYRSVVIKSNQGVAETMLALGEVLVEQSNIAEGISRLEEALLFAQETGRKTVVSTAHKELSVAYAKKGEIVHELTHLKKHYALEKEINTEDLKKRVDTFNMRVAIAEIEHGVELQKMKTTQLEHDLANSAIQLSTQTDLLDRFQSDLRLIVKEVDEPIAALRRIKEKLKALPSSQIDWHRFEMQFTTVHPEFKTKLEAKHPALTPQEIRMCSLVRVGLRNPEIAKLLCLSERTLENHRFNIRKKLTLKTKQSLQEFLVKNV
jgi:tetratricopeptide (TPR) repeat protein/DNA-binding CsgD family transcriptional regulator